MSANVMMTPAQVEELAKTLSQMKQILQGTGTPWRFPTLSRAILGLMSLNPSHAETEATPEQQLQLVTGAIEEDLPLQLATNLWRLPFESRKDTQVILSAIFRFRPANSALKTDPVAMSWVVNHRPQVLIELCKAYEHKESATAAGSVLREMLKHQAAAAVILFDDGEEQGSSFKGIGGIDEDRQQSGNGVFWRFFEWIDKSSFEVAADAFTTFRVSSHIMTYRSTAQSVL